MYLLTINVEATFISLLKTAILERRAAKLKVSPLVRGELDIKAVYIRKGCLDYQSVSPKSKYQRIWSLTARNTNQEEEFYVSIYRPSVDLLNSSMRRIYPKNNDTSKSNSSCVVYHNNNTVSMDVSLQMEEHWQKDHQQQDDDPRTFKQEIEILKSQLAIVQAENSNLRNIPKDREDREIDMIMSQEDCSQKFKKALTMAIETMDPLSKHAIKGKKAISLYKEKYSTFFEDISNAIGLNLCGHELLTLNEKLSVSSSTTTTQKRSKH